MRISDWSSDVCSSDLGDNQSYTDRDIRVHTAAIGGNRDRQLVMIVDHRSTEAFAELGEIATQFDIAEPRCGELLLKGRDRHYAVVGVVEMASCLLGLHPPRALHEHAGDDLAAVGNALLEFLEPDRLLAQKVILEFFADARFGPAGAGPEPATPPGD